ncbi:hypothetical protein BLNAU_14409 [Blattamonas nauphoetae]|uniref:Uncharacterized protein n=1 Tax=Blattamonas nauphoetae TaxID=2049346 RepID=A0ABQ9XE39_9EUKA|nr:hypothetical protein BLNAU_14409 [Blattamonas nauphoetae]
MICSEKSRITPRRSLSLINSSNIRSSPSVQSASWPPSVLLIKHRRIRSIATVEISAQTSFRLDADSSASVCRHAVPLIETALPDLFSRVCTVETHNLSRSRGENASIEWTSPTTFEQTAELPNPTKSIILSIRRHKFQDLHENQAPVVLFLLCGGCIDLTECAASFLNVKNRLVGRVQNPVPDQLKVDFTQSMRTHFQDPPCLKTNRKVTAHIQCDICERGREDKAMKNQTFTVGFVEFSRTRFKIDRPFVPTTPDARIGRSGASESNGGGEEQTGQKVNKCFGGIAGVTIIWIL